MLSREEVELYQRDGYLPGRRVLSAAEAERLRDDCLRACAEPVAELTRCRRPSGALQPRIVSCDRRG